MNCKVGIIPSFTAFFLHRFTQLKSQNFRRAIKRHFVWSLPVQKSMWAIFVVVLYYRSKFFTEFIQVFRNSCLTQKLFFEGFEKSFDHGMEPCWPIAPNRGLMSEVLAHCFVRFTPKRWAFVRDNILRALAFFINSSLQKVLHFTWNGFLKKNHESNQVSGIMINNNSNIIGKKNSTERACLTASLWWSFHKSWNRLQFFLA